MSLRAIDTEFDARSDTPPGRDPDECSATLRRYHQRLWSRPLPDGSRFALDANGPANSLRCTQRLEGTRLASDCCNPSYIHWKKAQRIVEHAHADDSAAFESRRWTVGGSIVWPSQRRKGGQTINGARGFNSRIADRFDLTLECVRRHYAGIESPMSSVLHRYEDFLSVFIDFDGYVEFFLLQDLVNGQRSTIDFFLPFDDFEGSGMPRDAASYMRYRQAALTFIEQRNARIGQLACNEVDLP
ncbi:MAG: hypothetical protein WC054_14230 [Candidatus Nanopelagicales bacterium]